LLVGAEVPGPQPTDPVFELPDDLLFLACSGNTIEQTRGQLKQLEQRIAADDLDVELVLLSVGGNNSLFGTIGRTCLLPTDCTDLGAAWRENLATVEEDLKAFYEDLDEVVDAPVLVMPYPIPIADRSCDWSWLSSSEHDYLNAFTEELDQAVGRAAAAKGFFVVDTVPDALAGARICDRVDGKVVPAADAAVNFLAANSVFGTLEQSVSPTNWIHNSLHPNARGHERLHGAVLAWLAEHADELDEPAPSTSPLADRPAATFPTTGDACKGELREDLDACSWKEATSTTGVLLFGGLLVIAALGAGLYLVALNVVRLWRSLETP
jgi:hypothetical protein